MSPHFLLHGMSDSDPSGTFSTFASELNTTGIWVHPPGGSGWRQAGATAPEALIAPLIRAKFNGALMLNGGYDAASGNEVIENGLADLCPLGFFSRQPGSRSFRKACTAQFRDPSLFTLERNADSRIDLCNDGSTKCRCDPSTFSR